MLFEKFFKTISNALPTELFLGDIQALARLDTRKIYVENVRSVLQVSNAAAARICETAVRQGIFLRFVEVLCPDGSVAASAEREEALPIAVRCHSEAGDFIDEAEIPTGQLEKKVFYRLVDDGEAEDPQPHPATA